MLGRWRSLKKMRVSDVRGSGRLKNASVRLEKIGSERSERQRRCESRSWIRGPSGRSRRKMLKRNCEDEEEYEEDYQGPG
jgi:hypothetical protein